MIPNISHTYIHTSTHSIHGKKTESPIHPNGNNDVSCLSAMGSFFSTVFLLIFQILCNEFILFKHFYCIFPITILPPHGPFPPSTPHSGPWPWVLFHFSLAPPPPNLPHPQPELYFFIIQKQPLN